MEELAPISRAIRVELTDGFSVCIGNAQEQGSRNYQEDSYGFSSISPEICREFGFLALLADGMGGLSNGKAVSDLVISGMLSRFQPTAPGAQSLSNGKTLLDALLEINKTVCQRFCADGSVRSGSTAVCALILGRRLHWATIGDSRLYLHRQGRLYQINEDTDCLNLRLGEALAGMGSFEDAFSDPQKDALADCIGKANPEHPERSVFGIPLVSGDRLILCSDGVYNALSPEEFCQLAEGDAQLAAEQIAEAVLAKHYPYQDNLTVSVIVCAESPEFSFQTQAL